MDILACCRGAFGDLFNGGCVVFNRFEAIAKKLPKNVPANLTSAELSRVKLLGAYGYVAGRSAKKKGVDKTRTHLNQTVYEFADTSDLNNLDEKAELLTDSHLTELKQRGIKIRKDNTLLLDFMGSLPAKPPEYIDAAKINDYLDAYFVAVQRFFTAHAPDSIITVACTHHDQPAPHIHVYVIPIKDGKLAASALLGKKNQVQSFHEWFEVELKRIYKQKGLIPIPYQRTSLQDKKAKESKRLQAQNRIKNKRLSQSESKQKSRLKRALKKPSFAEIMTQTMNGAKPVKPLITRGKRSCEMQALFASLDKKPTQSQISQKPAKAHLLKATTESVSLSTNKKRKPPPRSNAPPQSNTS